MLFLLVARGGEPLVLGDAEPQSNPSAACRSTGQPASPPSSPKTSSVLYTGDFLYDGQVRERVRAVLRKYDINSIDGMRARSG